MIAPNGKQSNLTDSQYKLVRTPAFKEWFGDWEFNPSEASKVVDENGEPLVVYHGTNAEFNVFNKKGKGNRVLGYFFTTEKDFSENYGKSKLYFLNIKNIKNFNAQRFDSLNTRQNAENNYWELEKDKLLAEMYNGVLIDRNDLFADINFARKDYVAFESNQIKLADGTNTTFDSNNNDIRFDEGGNVKSQNLDAKLKDFGFEFNPYAYRYGKRINEDKYITAFYDKRKQLYKIRGTHKFKTPLGENSIGIQFDFDNEEDFFEKLNDIFNRFKQGGNVNELVEDVSTEYLNSIRNQDKSRWNYDLEKSIEKQGILEPVTIGYWSEYDKVTLVDGHHRLDTAIDLDIKSIPTIIQLYYNNPTGLHKLYQAPKYNPNAKKPSDLGIFKKGGMTNKGYVSYKDKYNTKYGYSKGESHDLKEISKDTGVSIKGLQQIYNKGIGAYRTNPSSVRPNVKSKEQWAMARVYSSVMGGKASKIDSNELKMERGGNINFKNNNMSKHKDGLFVGKSHKEGGIPMVVKSTGQRIEVEGGESITNKTSMADTKIRTLTGTNCEIISQINTQNGNGVAMDCDSVVGKKYEYRDGGSVGNDNFYVKSNFGNFSVTDRRSNKMVVGYRTKKGAELTAEGLNKLKTESAIEKRIKSLKTIKGYGHFLNQYADGGGVAQKDIVYFKPRILESKYPNFLTIIVKYPVGYGFLTALGQKTMSGQERDNGQIKANEISKSIIAKLNKQFNIEDIDVSDNKNGNIIIFAVSDDFVNLSKNTLEQKLKTNSYATGGQVSLFDGEEDFFGKKRFADGGSVSAKEIEEWRKYVLSNSSWFDNESDDSVEITLTTRENGDTYNEQAGQKDIDEAKNIYKKIISKFPKTQGKIERVDEYVYLHLKPSKSTEELEEEKRIETTQNQEKNSAKIISEKLNFSKEKAFDVVERLRYSKQYYEQYKNEKADRYNNSFRVYFQEGTPSNIKFNNAEEVFDYITKDDFIKSIYNRSNPRNKVQIGLYGWDSLLIKYDNDGFGVLENGKTDWSKRTKILQIFPYIESNIQNQEDFINKVKKAISEFILCYKIYVLNDYQEEKKVIVKPKKDLKTQKQVKDFLSNFSIIDKKIMGLRLALRVANKEDEKLIERRIKALEIANKTQVYADLNENEIKVLKAISISSKANGGDFTYFEYVMEEIKDLTQQQVKGYISQLKQKEYISVSEDEFSQIYAGKYHEYLTHYKFNN